MSMLTIKIVACIAMLLDHTQRTFHLNYVGDWFEILGRLSFPLFAFATATGCRRTRNIVHYAMRMLIVALISEPVFNLALNINNWIRFFSNDSSIPVLFVSGLSNVLFTHIFAIVAIVFYEKLQNHKFLSYLIVLLCTLATAFFHTDYGALGLLLIYGLYICKSKKTQSIYLFTWCTFFYLGYASWDGASFMWLDGGRWMAYWIPWLAACSAILFLHLYSPRLDSRGYKSLYLFYPVHLFILGAIRELILILKIA